MQYTQINVEGNVIRNEILEYLRQNKSRLLLGEPISYFGADRQWVVQTSAKGIEVNKLVDEVFDILLSSGRAKSININLDGSYLSSSKSGQLASAGPL